MEVNVLTAALDVIMGEGASVDMGNDGPIGMRRGCVAMGFSVGVRFRHIRVWGRCVGMGMGIGVGNDRIYMRHLAKKSSLRFRGPVPLACASDARGEMGCALRFFLKVKIKSRHFDSVC